MNTIHQSIEQACGACAALVVVTMAGCAMAVDDRERPIQASRQALERAFVVAEPEPPEPDISNIAGLSPAQCWWQTDCSWQPNNPTPTSAATREEGIIIGTDPVPGGLTNCPSCGFTYLNSILKISNYNGAFGALTLVSNQTNYIPYTPYVVWSYGQLGYSGVAMLAGGASEGPTFAIGPQQDVDDTLDLPLDVQAEDDQDTVELMAGSLDAECVYVRFTHADGGVPLDEALVCPQGADHCCFEGDADGCSCP